MDLWVGKKDIALPTQKMEKVGAKLLNDPPLKRTYNKNVTPVTQYY